MRFLWFLLSELRGILLLLLAKDCRCELVCPRFLLLLESLFADAIVLMLLVIVHFDKLGYRVQDVTMQLSLLLFRQLILKFIVHESRCWFLVCLLL